MDPRIGVIASPKISTAFVPRTVTAAVAFAAAVLGRHRAQAVTISRPDLALARRGAGETKHFHNGAHFALNAEVTIHDHPMFVAASRILAESNRLEGGFDAAQAAALFDRLFSRETRISTFETAAARRGSETPARGAARGLVPGSGMIERVLPKPARAIAAPPLNNSPAAAGELAQESTWGPPVRTAVEPKSITLGAPEIRRVADQVIREIDHRLVSRRERMGGR